MRKILLLPWVLLLFYSCAKENKKIKNSIKAEISKSKLTTSSNDCEEYLMKRKKENLNISILLVSHPPFFLLED